jgi:hypothetical protein
VARRSSTTSRRGRRTTRKRAAIRRRRDQEKAMKAAERIGKCTIEAGVPLEKLQSALSGI